MASLLYCNCSSSNFHFFSSRRIFELAPVALNMYSFGPEFKGKEEELYKSESFKAHAQGVVKMLDAAVNMMGPDLQPVTRTLTKLGASHVKYGVLPVHYGIVGEALMHTLATALGDNWTPQVKKGWEGVYTFVSTAMISGAEWELKRQEKRKLRLKKPKQESTSLSSEMPVTTNKKPIERPRARSRVTEALRSIIELRDVIKSSVDSNQKVATFIDNALDTMGNSEENVRSEDADSVASSTTSFTEPEDGVAYAQLIEQVHLSWDLVKSIPNYEEVAGVLLFKT